MVCFDETSKQLIDDTSERTASHPDESGVMTTNAEAMEHATCSYSANPGAAGGTSKLPSVASLWTSLSR